MSEIMFRKSLMIQDIIDAPERKIVATNCGVLLVWCECGVQAGQRQ